MREVDAAPRPGNRALAVYLSFWYIVTTSIFALLYLLPRTRQHLFFLFDPKARFSDLTDYAGKVALLHTQGSVAFGRGLPVFNYPAAAALLYDFFLHLFAHPVRAYLAVALCGLLAAAMVPIAAAQRQTRLMMVAVAGTLYFSYPVLFCLDRGNLEIVVWIPLAAGLILILSGRPVAGAVAVGIAAACKPFPAAFLLLLLVRRQYRAFAAGVAAFVIVYGVSLTVLGPTPLTAYRNLQPGFAVYYAHYVLGYLGAGEQRFLHSLLDMLKVIRASLGHFQHPRRTPEYFETAATAAPLLPLYFALVAVIGAVMAWTLWRKPVLNQLLGIALAITLLPPASADYTLLQLLVPIAAIAFAVLDRVTENGLPSTRKMLLFFVPFALLMTPLTYHGKAQTLLHGGLLLILIAATCTVALPSRFDRSMLAASSLQ